MASSPRRLTAADLDSCEWQLPLDPQGANHRFGLAETYHLKERETDRLADPCHHVFAVLSTITGLSLGLAERDAPFTPPALLQEVNPDDLKLLASRASDVGNDDLRARIRDLSWVINHDHKAGKDAIADYLAAAKDFSSSGASFLHVSRLRRALRLARSLGDLPLRDVVVEEIEAFLDEYDITHETRFLAREFMELLLDTKLGDPVRQSSNAERIAKASDAAGEWDRALVHWQLKAKFDERRGQNESARTARIAAAASHAAQAREEAAKGAPWTGTAATHLLEAMKMYRDAGEASQADALHAEVLALQQKARSEAQSFSVEMDFTQYVDRARVAVRGKELFPALASLAMVTEPTSIDWLRTQTDEEIRAFPFQHWIQETLGDERGRTIARRQGYGDDETNNERAIRVDMLKNAEWMRGAKVLSHIEPARHQITLDHQPQLHHLRDLVAISPFVPNDRTELFARGLLAGLQGDFLIATHLLVPQLENSIRLIFEQHGVLTTTLFHDDIQEDRTLGALLQSDRFQAAGKAIFGEDLFFDLRGVLVERWGANLRNRVAHGMMSDIVFSQVQCSYVWWLTLRLVMWPHLLAMQEGSGPDVEIVPD